MGIELKNLDKYYFYKTKSEKHVLKKIDLKIDDGELIAIVGKSGAGKSTLLHVLACIDNFQNGDYILNGYEIKKLSDNKKSKLRNEYIGIVLQDFGLIGENTVFDNVKLPLMFSKKYKKNEINNVVDSVLEKVDIKELKNQCANKISGGQKQRTAIARAIINNPKILLCDEPTGALDHDTAIEIMELFKKLNKEGVTIIIVTHDTEIASMCNRVIKIVNGEILECNQSL